MDCKVSDYTDDPTDPNEFWVKEILIPCCFYKKKANASGIINKQAKKKKQPI